MAAGVSGIYWTGSGSRKSAPYWTKHAQFAADHGVKVAIEMHPGFVVYSPETMLQAARHRWRDNRVQLRSEPHVLAGHRSHQSHPRAGRLDLPRARERHADLRRNLPVSGVLDTKKYTDEQHRAWIFRSVGYGHDAEWWKEFISTLRMYGYDYVLSIEHEDTLMSPDEGLTKGAAFLNAHRDRGSADGAVVGVARVNS